MILSYVVSVQLKSSWLNPENSEYSLSCIVSAVNIEAATLLILKL